MLFPSRRQPGRCPAHLPVPSETLGRPRPLLRGGGLPSPGEVLLAWVGVWDGRRSAGRSRARAPGCNAEFSMSSFPFPPAPPLLSPSPGSTSARGFSLVLPLPCCRCSCLSVPRPSHDFSFCLSDSFKQKHTSKAPQRGSSPHFSDFWFSCPFSPALFLLPFSSPVMLVLNLQRHGGRSRGARILPQSSEPWSPRHCLSPASLL